MCSGINIQFCGINTQLDMPLLCIFTKNPAMPADSQMWETTGRKKNNIVQICHM